MASREGCERDDAISISKVSGDQAKGGVRQELSAALGQGWAEQDIAHHGFSEGSRKGQVKKIRTGTDAR